MLSPMWIIVLIIVFLESGISITLNTYIVITDVRNIKNVLKRNPSYLIRVVMGLLNIVIQCSLTAQGSLYVISLPILFIKEVYLSFAVITLTMVYCSFWLTAWLCAYYCTRITNVRYGLCDWLKRISSTSQMLLLLLLAVGSFLISLLCIWNTKVEIEVQSSENSTIGATFISGTFLFNRLYIIIALFLGCFLPFILIISSIMLTFSSLLRHMIKIKQNDSGFTRPKLQAHINAIRTMILLLILFIIFHIAEIILFTNNMSSSLNGLTVFGFSSVMTYPTAEAIIIAQANSKLRKILVETFCPVRWRNTGTQN